MPSWLMLLHPCILRGLHCVSLDGLKRSQRLIYWIYWIYHRRRCRRHHIVVIATGTAGPHSKRERNSRNGR